MIRMAKRQTTCAVALAVIAIVLAACASAPAPAQSPAITLAVTMLIPTATPMPPTATPAPPTSTPQPAPSDALQLLADDPLREAILKTSAAESYRIEMSMTGSGQPFAALSGGDADTEVTLMAITGEYSRQHAAFTMSGLTTALLGGGQGDVQVITAEGKTYIRGPALLLGALEERWYILPDEQAGLARAPIDTLQFLRRFADANAGEFRFEREGSQEFDGRPCDVYTADAPATREALASFGANVLPGAGSLSMQAGEFRIWACDDGYVHRLQMSFDLGSTDDENKVIVFKADVRLGDHGAALTIVAPADAAALDLPGLITPAP
jgi:hypothetical protein